VKIERALQIVDAFYLPIGPSAVLAAEVRRLRALLTAIEQEAELYGDMSEDRLRQILDRTEVGS